MPSEIIHIVKIYASSSSSLVSSMFVNLINPFSNCVTDKKGFIYNFFRLPQNKKREQTQLLYVLRFVTPARNAIFNYTYLIRFVLQIGKSARTINDNTIQNYNKKIESVKNV